MSWKVTVARYVIHIVGWIIVSVIYRYEKSLHGNENDLWGWTCSTKADDIQAAFHGVVSFDALCRVQVTTQCSIYKAVTLTPGRQTRGIPP